MISYISGTILFKGIKDIVIDVQGIGYRVFCGAETLQKIPEKGTKVNLWTHHTVREDAHELFGFFHREELEFFELLIGISGIGPKSALGVMALAPLDTLKRAIAAGEITYLTKVSGIGKKMVQKIILELREKLAGEATGEAGELAGDADALEALLSLGYSRAQARAALQKLPATIISPNDRIKESIKILGR
jgi:Holliday junction DNA helicase RuvA